MSETIRNRSRQHFWHIILSGFFVALLVLEMVALDLYAYRSFSSLNVFDIVLITLATWRLIRLFVYDKIMSFFRDIFYSVNEEGKLVMPVTGFRRAVLDLLLCPWCFGVWAAAMTVFFYFLTPYAFFPVFVLAISVIASTLQVITNAIGWTAEKKKREVENMPHIHTSDQYCEKCG